MKNTTLITLVFLCQAIAFTQPLKSYTWDTAALMLCRQKALANDATVTLAVNTIKTNANKYVNLAPVNITQKTAGWLKYFPDGTTFSSKEYVSFSEYYWPVSGHATDGTPWQYEEALGPDTAIAASINNRIATISWNTIGESDMLGYEVEKSIDGVNFTLFDKVTAKNMATASYLIKDNQLVTGKYYYRVKAISNTGVTTYSRKYMHHTFYRCSCWQILGYDI